MATVTPQMVKELRELTGAGMADCKKALDQAEGSMEKAVVFLRERGLAAAQKKSGRAAAEGMVAAIVTPEGDKGFLVEVNCETDFVTRNDEYLKFVSTVQEIVLNKKPADLDALLATAYPTGGTIKDTLTALIAKIGENMMIRRYQQLGGSGTFVTSYVHGSGKIGVLVELEGTNVATHRANPELAEVGKNVALQAAAMKPNFLNRESVDLAVIEREKEVFFNQYRNQGKPEAALPKIVANRLETWFKEGCLVEQLFVKDESKTISAMVSEAGRKLGIPDLKVKNYVRLELGEGVEKKSDDFAAEVAAQMAAATKG